MNKKQLTDAEQQELLLRMKKNYTYDAKSGRLTSSRLGRAIRAVWASDRYLFVCTMPSGLSAKVVSQNGRLTM